MPVYITVPQPPRFRQPSFEELFREEPLADDFDYEADMTATRTFKRNVVPYRMKQVTDVDGMIEKLRSFNAYTKTLRDQNRRDQYKRFYLPKKDAYSKPRNQWTKDDWRPIDAPIDELKVAMEDLQSKLNSMMLASYHQNAYAYISGRDTIGDVAKHQRAVNNWFTKLDFHGFFPSTNLDFILRMFRMVYPFNLIMSRNDGHLQLKTALEFCMLEGGLPQGSPISPWITNVMMIPFDYEFAAATNNFVTGYKRKDGKEYTQRYTVTRYADDIIVSAKFDYKSKLLEDLVVKILNDFKAPFELNKKKTHYGSRAGHNYLLGVCLNADNEIKVGFKKNKLMKATIDNYIEDKMAGVTWDLDRLNTFNGNLSYYSHVEKGSMDYMIDWFNRKYKINLLEMVRADLAAGYVA